MSFIDKVNNVRDGVLSRPEYNVAIKSVIDRATKYTAEKKIEETLTAKEEEITL